MALQFEVETVEGLDENIASLYVEHDGKYRLAVEGIDPADELKSALQKEREERKQAKLKLAELEAERQAALAEKEEREKQSMLEKEQFKELYEAEKQRAEQTTQELQEYQKRIDMKALELEANQLASSNAAGDGQAVLLAEQIAKYAKVTDGVVSYEMGGIQVTANDVIEHLKGKQPFLFKGNGSTGGGATGAVRSGSGATRVNAGDMGGSPQQRIAAIEAKYDFSALQ